MAALRTFALIDRETVADERDPTVITDCIRLHRLVRQVAAARCEGEVREGAQRVLVEALVAVYPENIWRDPQTWRLSRRLDSHALALVGDDATAPKGVEQRTADLLSFAGFYRHYALAAYVETRPLYERALAIWEKVLGAEHSGTASSLGNLALLFRDLGRPDKAEPLFLRAIAVGDKALGAEHPLTRRYQSHYARLMMMTDRPAEALQLARTALAAQERVMVRPTPGPGTPPASPQMRSPSSAAPRRPRRCARNIASKIGTYDRHGGAAALSLMCLALRPPTRAPLG